MALSLDNGHSRVEHHEQSGSNTDPQAHTITMEHDENPSTNQPVTPTVPRESSSPNETTWIDSYGRWDRYLSGSSMHLCYRIIDIFVLLVGLSSSVRLCTLSNRLAVTSICILIFYFIDLAIIIHFLIRNLSVDNRNRTDEEQNEQLRHASTLRGLFIFFKLIPVCFGVGYAFSSTVPSNNDCEILRVCLGIVSFSTLLIMIMPPTKPELPIRRSFLAEIFVLSFLLIINGLYFGTIITATHNTQNVSSCILENIDDIYLGAPLKSYAEIGIILYGLLITFHILNVLFQQLSHRCTFFRGFYSYYYAFQYFINYIGGLCIIYYLSMGAIFLFQPRSGDPCREVAPNLYQTLLIWHWLRIVAPLIAVPLILLLCCLGVVFGIIFSYCLPASITVPILELLRVRFVRLIFASIYSNSLSRVGYRLLRFESIRILQLRKLALMLCLPFYLDKNLISLIKLNG